MGCSEQDYAFLRAAAASLSANRNGTARNAALDQQLRPVVEEAGVADLRSLVELMRASPAPTLHHAVAEAATIKETSFFRDPPAFRALARHVLPKLLKARESQRRLLIWSAAASTGQEAYSLAMLLLENFPQLSDWKVQVVGTDISAAACTYASEGRYRRVEVTRGLAPRLLTRYFERTGEFWQVRPQVKRMVSFQRMNLCKPLCTGGVYDVILLRNVLLYFASADQSRVLAQVHRQLRPDGALMLGASEQAEDSSDLFEVEFQQDSYFYRPLARRESGRNFTVAPRS